jgi:hypothetical protein
MDIRTEGEGGEFSENGSGYCDSARETNSRSSYSGSW